MADEESDPKVDDEGNPIEIEGGEEPLKKDEGTEPLEGGEGGEEGKEEEPPEDLDIEEKDIPVRSSMEHIIARKNKQIEKLKSKPADDDYDPDDDDDGDDDGGLKKQVKVLTDAVIGTADETDLQTLFKKEPKAAELENSIRSYMKHPAYKGVAPAVIFHHLAFDNAARIGAKKKAIADKEAGDASGAGKGNRASGGGGKQALPTEAEMRDMSDEETIKLGNDIQQGKYELE